ncbi:ABC transporter permease [Clostridium perfringens]|uniref:ABC transporter permease n=1 Tax=Clostridium perfringens TaxID=1502 RepID=UPI0039ED3A4C
MLNLIKAELYKIARRPLYITICIIFNLLIILAGIAMHYAFLENSRIPDFSALVFITINFMGAIPWIMLMFIDIVLEEYKENTLKNLISSSISKEKVYLSKYIVQVIIFLVIEITAVLTMIGTSYALGLVGPNGFSDFMEVILRLLIAFPIYISALAIYDFITIITKKEGLAVVVILGIVSGVPMIFSILSSIYEGIFTLIYPYLLFNPLKSLVSEVLTTKIIGTNIIVGIINTVVFLILGILVIRKQEVK